MKRFFSAFLICFLLVFVLSSCDNNTTNDSSEKTEEQVKNETIYIPIISKGQEHQFWKAVKAGADKAAKEFGVEITFEGPASESEVDKQIEMLKTALSKNPSAICLAALDSKKIQEYLVQASDNGVPIIGFDSGVDSELTLTSASTDDYAASAYAAGKMAEFLNYEGKIAVICHSETSVNRRDGFVHAVQEKYPKLQIVTIEYTGGDVAKSMDATKKMLAKYPEIKGIFGTNEGCAVGCVNGIKELKKDGEIIIIGFDSGKAQMDAIRKGIEKGAITQNPVGIGYKAVEAAVRAIRNEQVDKIIDTGFYWYDKNNIDDDEIQAVLYE